MRDNELERIEQRIRELQSELCERVRKGEITDMEANEIANETADRLYRDGAWN